MKSRFLAFLIGCVLSSSVIALPKADLSVEEAKNFINGVTPTIPDEDGVRVWEIFWDQQPSGWKFDKEKALTVLARPEAKAMISTGLAADMATQKHLRRLLY